MASVLQAYTPSPAVRSLGEPLALGEIEMAASQTPSVWIPSFMLHLSCSGLSEHATLTPSSAFYNDAST